MTKRDLTDLRFLHTMLALLGRESEARASLPVHG
jgi:hypothetical protein